MMTITDKLRQLGFADAITVEGRASVADLFKRNKRCGIYVLHCSNNEYYVGQAVDVVRRYAQHRHTHIDICQMSFKTVPKKQLTDEERSIVYELERVGCRLRNILLVNFSYGETDFDLIMPREQQTRWLAEYDYVDLSGDRIINPDFRRKYTARYMEFLNSPYAADIIEVLREYALKCVPVIKKSEMAFWSISCFPGNSRQIYARLNISWQTTFDVLFTGKEVMFRWFLTAELAHRFTNQVQRLINWNAAPSPLIFGGPNQVFIHSRGKHNAMKRLNDPRFIGAVREFNLNLMRKGPCSASRYHCLDLADRLIE